MTAAPPLTYGHQEPAAPTRNRAAAELDAHRISAWFGTNKVLDRVSLTMPAGRVTALIGPSGCGKSTFLRILNRMHESVPSAKLAGEVRLNGDDIYASGHRITETRRRIGMVFQKPNPFPAMSIADNVTAGLKLTGTRINRTQRQELIERSLRRAGLWDEVKDRLHQPGSALSGGQQQRLCIARSLAVDPDVLLMDEPCSALDPTSTRRVEDRPREVAAGLSPADHVFRNAVRAIGVVVLLLTGAIGVFLGYQAIPTFKRYGFTFFTQSQWQPQFDKVGISAVLLGTVIVAVIALVVGFPLAFLTALYISEYAPARFKGAAVASIDLMAAVPSIIYGLFGFKFLEPHAQNVARWLHQNLGFIPIFKVDTDPNAASWAPADYYGSAFIGGVCVSLMIIPLACSVMRGVFALAPLGEREAALALGSTKWGMIRTVVLPFGRGGIIGGTMLGLGRALGETVAVMLVISQVFDIKFKVLSSGTNTISALIASRFSEATSAQLAALLTAGFVLFLLTLAVNTVAAVFVARGRSGAGVEI